MVFYLAGAVAHDPEGNEWRERVIAEVPNHDFINPIKDETGEMDYREILADMKNQADVAGDDLQKYLDIIRDIVLNKIMPKDLDEVYASDALICYVKKGKRIFGSACEMFYAKWELEMPVYLISELWFSEMNNWEIALADKIFLSLEYAITWLKGYDG